MVHFRIHPLKALALLALLMARSAEAQDSQYWDIQYGPIAQLLGGLVVGSSRDLSATYYNPGGLSLGKSSDFLLSGEAFKAEFLSTRPLAGGAFLDKKQTQFDVFPGFFAFSFPKSWFGEKNHVAFSLLTRQLFNMRLDQRFAGETTTGGGRYGLETLFDQRMSETWGGLTLSRKISSRLGLGATLYGVYRGQRTRKEQSVQVLYPDGHGVSALVIDDFDYSHWGMLGKIGVAWEGEKLRLGGAITTPRLSVLGSGNVGFTRSAAGVDLNGDGKIDNVLLNGFDEGLKSDYDTAWAISAGASWRRRSIQLHVSAEYFAPVHDITVLMSPSVDSAGNPITLIEKLDGVFNAGVGGEYWFGGVAADNGASARTTVVYGAFATDFTASPEVLGNEAASSNINLYHVSGGTAFSLGSSRFSVGGTVAFGHRTRDFGFSGLPPGVPFLGEGIPIETRYTRVVFVLGYLFGSNK